MIPVFEVSPGLFQGDKQVGAIWENYRNVKGNFHKQSAAISQRYGALCPSVGCSHRAIPDSYFSEFIRNYWDCPMGD
jgi:hypothetical protein